MLFFLAQILAMRFGLCSGTVSGGIPLSSPQGWVHGVFQSEDRISFTQYLVIQKNSSRYNKEK